MHVFNSLMPVFLVIVLGKALTKTSFFSRDLARNINQLTYWVALPALLFSKISAAVFESAEVSRVTMVLVLSTLAGFALGWLAAFPLRLSRRSAGAFIQGCGRANNAFVGLPVILYALAGQSGQIESLATIALAPAMIFYNISSIIILLHYGEKGSQRTGTARLFLQQLVLNPLLISCALGLLVNVSGGAIPMMFQRTFDALGQAALPLALLCIGSSLSFEGLRRAALPSFVASALKVFALPALGLVLCRAGGLSPTETRIALIYLACPTATASYVLADIFGSDADLAGRIIVISTLLSAVSLSLVLALGG